MFHAPAFGVYTGISPLTWYFRAFVSYHKGLLLTNRLLNQGFLVIELSNHFERFLVAIMTWLTIINVFVTDDHVYVLFVIAKSYAFLIHDWFLSRDTWPVPLVEQELLTLLEHLSWPLFLCSSCYSISSFLCSVLWTIVCLFVLLRFTYYYPLANEVAKGYSNATVRPSFRNILVNTLESTSFNGFWPNLVHT